MKLSNFAKLSLLAQPLLAGSAIANESGPISRGESAYRQICFICHDKGVHITAALGAPRLGDIRAWETRHTRGVEGLYGRVVHDRPERLQMPTGGLADEDIKAAIEYMLESSRP